ncbi:hypothetical protein ACFORL_06600 [Legionella dresdenensis]|uniref:Ankyrin repeats (3 copies) n=1 Tax=Legionella dresdenensis TaxID=450200 RepID=A0ABV8CEU2_9GAMM
MTNMINWKEELKLYGYTVKEGDDYERSFREQDNKRYRSVVQNIRHMSHAIIDGDDSPFFHPLFDLGNPVLSRTCAYFVSPERKKDIYQKLSQRAQTRQNLAEWAIFLNQPRPEKSIIEATYNAKNALPALAASCGQLDDLKYYQKFFNLQFTSTDKSKGVDLLKKADEHGEADIVLYLVQQGVQIPQKAFAFKNHMEKINKWGGGAAQENKVIQLIKLLNEKNHPLPQDVLYWAATYNCTTIIAYLLDPKNGLPADAYTYREGGRTPIERAIHCHAHEALPLLLNKIKFSFRLAIREAIEANNFTAIETILDWNRLQDANSDKSVKPITIDERFWNSTVDQQTFLETACENERLDMVQYLLAKGASPVAIGNSRSALEYAAAATRNAQEMVLLLIVKKAPLTPHCAFKVLQLVIASGQPAPVKYALTEITTKQLLPIKNVIRELRSTDFINDPEISSQLTAALTTASKKKRYVPASTFVSGRQASFLDNDEPDNLTPLNDTPVNMLKATLQISAHELQAPNRGYVERLISASERVLKTNYGSKSDRQEKAMALLILADKLSTASEDKLLDAINEWKTSPLSHGYNLYAENGKTCYSIVSTHRRDSWFNPKFPASKVEIDNIINELEVRPRLQSQH